MIIEQIDYLQDVKRMGPLDSDAVVGRYEREYAAMTTKYAIRKDSKVSWFRRLIRFIARYL